MSKVIVESPRQRMTSRDGHGRNDMRLRSADGEHDFSVFMRVSDRFPENFTIGLRHHPPDDESACLLRCNGDHGQHRNSVLDCGVISGRHIHQATEAAVRAGLAADHYAGAANQYVTYEQAVHYFLQRVNVTDWQTQAYFQFLAQPPLPDALAAWPGEDASVPRRPTEFEW